MGLDGVELVMEFEETFGVELEDEEVTKTTTPRMVCDLIYSKLKDKDEHSCQTQRAFYMLRKIFVTMFNLERKQVRPDMPFRNLIPKNQEKDRWEQIKTAIAAKQWPILERPLWMTRLLIAVGLVMVGAVICFGGLALGILLLLFYTITTFLLTRPFEICIQPCYQTVRDLIPYTLTSEKLKWSREGVSIFVKQIVIEQLGLDESEYTEDSRFVEDLHMD